MCGFEYEVIDGEVTIKWLMDRSVTSINIPEFIDGYPVTKILSNALGTTSLSEVNGSDICGNPLIINNKFILYSCFTYKISYNIGYDYISSFGVNWNYRYFIGDVLYDINFKVIY